MFSFKQFTVFQENSSMKVTTDACLFGSIIKDSEAIKVLDIGTGTGLLALMTAQRHPKWQIDAVDIDDGAVKDASVNFSLSPFNHQIRLYHQAIQNFEPEEQYDLILSNPPFYEHQLKSPDDNKNVAHHATKLNLTDLSEVVNKLLNQKGSFWVLLPPVSMKKLKEKLKNFNIIPKTVYHIRHNNKKPVFREVIEFSRNHLLKEETYDIAIYENDNYSTIFTKYLKDYYLIF